jgi:hypothetical protein
LADKQFKQLIAYATQRMKEEIPFEMQQEVTMNR